VHCSQSSGRCISLPDALTIFDGLGKPTEVAQLLTAIGAVDQGLRRYSDALAADERAQSIHHALNLQAEEALDFHQLATAEEQLRDRDAALGAEQNALTLYTALADRQGEALALQFIGSLQAASGREEAFGNRETAQLQRSVQLAKQDQCTPEDEREYHPTVSRTDPRPSPMRNS
jgi:hypothetical protein